VGEWSTAQNHASSRLADLSTSLPSCSPTVTPTLTVALTLTVPPPVQARPSRAPNFSESETQRSSSSCRYSPVRYKHSHYHTQRSYVRRHCTATAPAHTIAYTCTHTRTALSPNPPLLHCHPRLYILHHCSGPPWSVGCSQVSVPDICAEGPTPS
jgi:hypothetical protein